MPKTITCCTPRVAGSPKNASSLSRPFYPTLPCRPPLPDRRRVSSAKELRKGKLRQGTPDDDSSFAIGSCRHSRREGRVSKTAAVGGIGA